MTSEELFSEIQDLRAAYQHDTRRIQEVVERAVKPDSAHGSCTDDVTRIQTVHDPVDSADYDQKDLIGQQAKNRADNSLRSDNYVSI